MHYPAIPHCATTAFAVGATADTVSVDCLAAQRHTVIPHVFSDCAAFQCFFAYLFLLSALRAGVFGAGYHGARLAGRTCGAPVGGALRAPLGGTWCRGSGVTLYSTVTYRAATAFAVDATAHAVFADCLAVQRRTAILRTFCEIRCISMHSPLTISGGFLPHHDGAPQAGGTCGAPGGEV